MAKRPASERSRGLLAEGLALFALGAPVALLAAAGSALITILLFGNG